MVGLTSQDDAAAFARYLAALRREHAFWMHGESGLAPGGDASARLVRLPDGALLNRYWDDLDTPRDESYREDVALAQQTPRPSAELYRDIRAAAESG